MDLYEHLGKDLFRAHGIATPRGIVADDAPSRRPTATARARRAQRREGAGPGRRPRQGRRRRARRLAGAGRRGGRADARHGLQGARGDRRCSSRSCCRSRASSTRRSCSTGPPASYLAMMTAEGGMDIEELARTRPEALRRVHVDAMLGLRAFHVRELTGVAAGRRARGRRPTCSASSVRAAGSATRRSSR